jgi:hypothetical protein
MGWQVELEETRRGASRRAARLSDGLAVIEVMTMPQEIRRQALANWANAQALVAREFNGVDARLKSLEQTRIDGLAAWRLSALASRVPMVSINAGRRLSDLQQPAPRHESLMFRGWLVIVRGRGTDYLIKAWADDGYFKAQGWRLEAFLASFRVTRRPLPSF